MTNFAKKPKKPIPSATKIQKVPCLPALDFLAMSHMIKNKKPMKIGNKIYRPAEVMVSAEMLIKILFGVGKIATL